MTARRRFLAACLGALLAASAALPSSATANTDLPKGSIPGLIATVEPGAKAPTGGYLVSSRALGNRLFALSFSHPTTASFATRVMRSLENQPGVLELSLDHELTSATNAGGVRSANPLVIAGSTNASAPRKLSSRDIATNAELGTAQLRWRAPSSLAGGKLAFYELSLSKDAGATFETAQRIAASSTKLTLKFLTPGRKYLARLTSVVKRSGKYFRGKSAAISLVTTAKPRPPVMTSPNQIFAPTVVTWLKQTNFQAGGLPVKYSVSLVVGSKAEAVCSTSANFCKIDAPAITAGYRVTVTATNSRGNATSDFLDTNQDALFDQQWSLTGDFGINAENAWVKSRGGPVVAVIDSGVAEHPDLAGSLLRATDGKPYGFDFVTDPESSADGDGWDADPSDPGDAGPAAVSSWHGTSVAGLIAAGHDKIGIAGVAPESPLLSVRAVGSKNGKVSDLLAAVNWAAGIPVPNAPVNVHPAKIINLSIASEVDYACDGAARSTFNAVRARGVVVVVAAGNRGADAQKSFPASCTNVLVVAASTYDGTLAAYSNSGRRIDVAAPGGEVNYSNPPWAQGLMTTSNSGSTTAAASTYRMLSGTSLATPLVSGVIALMLDVNPSLSPANVKSILRLAVKPFAANSYCRSLDSCGPGIVDAAVAVELAATYGW